jgi:catalase
VERGGQDQRGRSRLPSPRPLGCDRERRPSERELGLQLFDEGFAARFPFDVLDPTKIIPEEELPVRRVGRLVLDRVVDNFFAETEQVAFCTQNIVPGIDFSDDPLLQGRNFSYLDTQLKRLGSPNFTEIPVNRPRGCPFHNFQRDGHMRMTVDKGRVNYQPNSWGEGPRESPEKGFSGYAAKVEGPKLRIRPESFADHYSQARQFYISQTEVEQGHIAAALTFELSKVETPAIRARVVSHLRNIDEALARKVASDLRLKELPAPAPAAVPTRADLAKSPALSILLNGPESFAGRTIGALVTDGVDADLVAALRKAVTKEGAMLKLVAPMVGGVEASDGSWLEADEKIDGGPSVLFDAVAVLPSQQGATLLANESTARDFVADAFAHLKIIGCNEAAAPLLEKAGVPSRRDEGVVTLNREGDVELFIVACRKLRVWSREPMVKVV